MATSLADSKASLPSTSAGKWSQLSVVVVAQIMTWNSEARSVAAMQATCKNWASIPPERLEAVWRTLYPVEFEPSSADDAAVAPELKTPWTKRFANRTRIVSCRTWIQPDII